MHGGIAGRVTLLGCGGWMEGSGQQVMVKE